MFRRYTTIHIMVTIAAFAVSLTWIIISASKHSTAASDCENDFFATANSSTASSTLNEGETLCNIFTWVDVGLMGGLWVILAIMQVRNSTHTHMPSVFLYSHTSFHPRSSIFTPSFHHMARVSATTTRGTSPSTPSRTSTVGSRSRTAPTPGMLGRPSTRTPHRRRSRATSATGATRVTRACRRYLRRSRSRRHAQSTPSANPSQTTGAAGTHHSARARTPPRAKDPSVARLHNLVMPIPRSRSPLHMGMPIAIILVLPPRMGTTLSGQGALKHTLVRRLDPPAPTLP